MKAEADEARAELEKLRHFHLQATMGAERPEASQSHPRHPATDAEADSSYGGKVIYNHGGW